MHHSISRDGFTLIEDFLADVQINALIAAVDQSDGANTRRGGIRNLLTISDVNDLASSFSVRAMVEEILGPEARVVRGTLFDKTAGANWKVPWHQDVTIEVQSRVDVEGFGPWSMKAGVLNVQPPSSVMDQMISLRFHLDDCPEQNGALRVIPGTHIRGKLGEREVQGIGEGSASVVCSMKRGGLLMMRPLLVHASSASATPGHRRVIHLDFSAATLPTGMAWAAAQA